MRSEKAASRIKHVNEHVYGAIERSDFMAGVVESIENAVPHARGCFGILWSNAQANAINSWFFDRNLIASKNWFYVRSKLEFIASCEPYNIYPQNMGFRGLLDGLCYILSDNEGLIHWWSTTDKIIDTKDASNVKKSEYCSKQFFLALRGEWDELIGRCESILADPPADSKVKRFMPDYRFYLALAKGDVGPFQTGSGWKAAIQQI